MTEIQEILDVPWPLLEYQAWLEKEPLAAADDYLFAQSRIRFEPADDDRLTLFEAATAVEQNAQACVQISNQAPVIPIPSLTLGTLRSLLEALRLRPILVELPFAAGVVRRDCDQLMRVGFGRFVFAPEAVASLDRHAAASEVVRFPASPYEIVRSYWKNVGDLSTEISRTIDAPVDRFAFVAWLRECHVKLLMGVALDTFYRPSSPIARVRVMPGGLYTRRTQWVTTPRGVYIIEGPRINASPVGGAVYHKLLQSSLNTLNGQQQPDAAAELDWGAVIMARARTDERDSEWFVPPRPIAPDHLDILCSAWNRAVAARNKHDVGTTISELARFHWCFVRLHPFACANQSLAFTLINCVLRQLLGCGIPQLILDQLALRLSSAEYSRVFSRAVYAWQTQASNELERQKERIHKRQRLDRFIAAIGSATTEREVQALVCQDPDGLRLALLESAT